MESRIKQLKDSGLNQKEVKKIVFQEFKKYILNEAHYFELKIMIREAFES